MVDIVGEAREGIEVIDVIPYGRTLVGKKEANQDALLLHDPAVVHSESGAGDLHGVYAVADGVGGQEGGARASSSVVKKIREYAVRNLYLRPKDLRSINGEIPAGATTLVLAQQLGERNTYLITSVGDSSAIVVDTHERTVRELTKRDEGSDGKLTQALGPEYDGALRPNELEVRLLPWQTLLLATDGFTKCIDKGRITSGDILKSRAENPNNVSFIDALIDMSDRSGRTDDITLVAIPYNARLRH